MEVKQKNIQALVDYQEDLVRIVAKNRKSSHALSVEEIVSEINSHFINKLSEKSFEDEVSCKKFMYGMAVSFVKWTAQGSNNKDRKYKSQKVDLVFNDPDRPEVETLYDQIIATEGEEDSFHQKMMQSNKYENLKKIIFKYSDILSDQQKAVLPFVLKGRKQEDIAESIGVTHQAISHLTIDAFERIKAAININKSESEILNEGNASIKYIFSQERVDARKKKSKKV